MDPNLQLNAASTPAAQTSVDGATAALANPKSSPTLDTRFALHVLTYEVRSVCLGHTTEEVPRILDKLAAKCPRLYSRVFARMKADVNAAKAHGLEPSRYFPPCGVDFLSLAEEHCAKNGIEVRRVRVGEGGGREVLEIVPSDSAPLNRKVSERLQMSPGFRALFDLAYTLGREADAIADLADNTLYVAASTLAFGAFRTIDPTRKFGHELDHFDFGRLFERGIISPFQIAIHVKEGPGFGESLGPWRKQFTGEEIVNLKRDSAIRARRIKRWEESAFEMAHLLKYICIGLNSHAEEACAALVDISSRVATNILLDHPNVTIVPGFIRGVGKVRNIPGVGYLVGEVHDRKTSNHLQAFIPVLIKDLQSEFPTVCESDAWKKGGVGVPLPRSELPKIKAFAHAAMRDYLTALCGNFEDHLEIMAEQGRAGG